MAQEGRWIEEGLFYCGDGPPRDGAGRPEDWVELPHESYIGIAKGRLNDAMRAHPRAREAGVAAEDVEIRKADLEDVFIEVMERASAGVVAQGARA